MTDRVKRPDTPQPDPQPSLPKHLIRAVGLSSNDWHAAQVSDPHISRILTHLQNGTKPTPPLDRHLSFYCREWSNLLILNGVVYRKTVIDDTERLQLLLPEKLRLDVCHALHNDKLNYQKHLRLLYDELKITKHSQNSYAMNELKHCVYIAYTDTCIKVI